MENPVPTCPLVNNVSQQSNPMLNPDWEEPT